jgi:hypothetical protein
MKPTLINAVLSLCPGAEIVIRDDVIEWINPLPAPVTDDQIQNELLRLQNEFENNKYQRLRAEEYPDFRDYLDGVVKNDAAQIQAYIDACLAIKSKHPKTNKI